MITASRYHDFSAGHRVAGHENKCANLHGHNYRVTFHCTALQLDSIGRVLDFSGIKSGLCEWLELNWDHKFLLWKHDPLVEMILPDGQPDGSLGLILVPFNPTAENMAKYLVEVVGPKQLDPDIVLYKVEVQETRRCSASYSLPGY